jgi:redox-sensing transcriptional repressor
VRRILGTDRVWPVALVGAGNLGTALLRYRGFRKQRFEIVAVFDSAPSVAGRTVGKVKILHVRDMVKHIRSKGIRLAIVAVPAAAAQEVATRLAEAGVRGILNFAPVRIEVPPEVRVLGVDLAIQLEQLAFQVRAERGDGP